MNRLKVSFVKSHRFFGCAIFISSGFLLGLLMFLPRFSNFGFHAGFILLALLTIGIWHSMGRFKIHKVGRDEKDLKNVKTSNAQLSGFIKFLSEKFNVRILYIGLALIVAGICRFSVTGTLAAAYPSSGYILATLGIAAIVFAKFFNNRSDGRLHADIFVLLLAFASIMATLGSHGLWDCWETHYGEIARRQLEQNDWISMFWEKKWFFSKPILLFWMMNLGMVVMGVTVGPDQIPSHVEWGVRLFVGLLSVAVIYAVYLLIKKRFSLRAGVLTAVVLSTMPIFGFMARQAITDMPFVGFMTLAVVMFLLGVTAKKDSEVSYFYIPFFNNRRIALSVFHLVVAAYVFVVVPQVIYLATRSSKFIFGTNGQGGLREVKSKIEFSNINLSDYVNNIFGFKISGITDISLDYFISGLVFIAVFSGVLYTFRKENHVSRLCYLTMYLFLGLSVMAKGAAGLIFPLLGLLGYWFIRVPLNEIKKPGQFIKKHCNFLKSLMPVRGILLFLTVAAPWYVAIIFRHSNAFINRFFIHDHIKRISVGVHGENGLFPYYIEQLSYAVFPWIGILPFALFSWIAFYNKSEKTSSTDQAAFNAQKLIRTYLFSMFLTTFALLTLMTTKFHHYVFPLVIPAAIMTGLFINDLWEKKIPHTKIMSAISIAIIVIVAISLSSEPDKAKGVGHGYAQLVGLFIYKYSRPYPEGALFNISWEIKFFTILFTFALLGLFINKLKKPAILIFVLLSLAFGHFLFQHHMVKLAPHWTQKHLIEEYYQRRDSDNQKLVAFQMNWKGENFYTGNTVKTFVSTKNKKFEKWIKEHRGEKHFFITEYKRFSRMSKRAKASSGSFNKFSDACNKYRAGWADKL